ncbi:ThuA domain-containing protein [Catelliglobosispora koreensis]|uniref:ThuA domain-containing protein n=1 Tax=Catelliglobosispora koreensis TaxID=129052 RepID=UPI00037F6FB8|nr:ThuA domain-containing protein [Catelliglobosispora koreensis]
MSALRRVLACVVLASAFLLAPAPAQAAAFSVLVFSKTAGFRHDSIPAGIAAIQALGTANNFTVVATEDAAQFNDANLANYATVVWLSTTGDVLDATQQAAFERYIRAGGGYVGIHAAADTEYGWAWYGNLAGAYFSSHPAVQSATVKVEDPAHASTSGLPAKWTRTDEWYNFQANPRPRVHVLASLDEKTYSPGTPMGFDHPISWCQEFDGGKSWYTGLGHANETFNDTAFRNHLLGGINTTADAVASDCKASLNGSFQKIAIDSNTNNPMELDVAPDGRVFYIERDGRVQIILPAGGTVTAATLPVFTGNEDGLLGIRLDPNFASNGFIYLYYSPNTGGPRNQISRFTVSGNSLSLSTEAVLLQVTTQRNTCCHAGGSMTFDAAGNLYLATGDNTNPFESDGYSPLDERSGRQDFDAQRTSGNTNDLRGKIIRITPQANGTYTIPAGNLFPSGTANTRPEIFAMGFRNPFRIGVDKATNTLYAADYGPDAGAPNANRGPEGTVEWNVVTAGNYGWPYCHGNNYAYHDWTFPSGPSNGAHNCNAPVNNSPNNTGLQNLPPAKPATVDYDYGGNPLFPEIGGGGAPMGGPVYRYNASLNSSRKWPAYWDGKALFGEWNQNKMYTMQVTADGRSLVDINQLFAGMNVLRPMDLEFGPDGAMYLIEWGTGFGGNNADSGVYRIDYLPGDAAPIAVASATPTSGPTPLTVQFSSAGSNDPGGQVITYSWAFGDGTTSTAANPSKTYSIAGNYTAVLTVRDPGGKTGTASVPISVGNTVPAVNMTYPLDGGFFAWGDQIRYTTTVTDPDETINCTRLVLQYYLGHDEHGHPIQNYTGCSGSVATASNSGHGDDANVFSVFEAAYTDNGGLVGRSNKVLQPKHKQAEHFSGTGRAPGGIGTGDPGVVREATGDTAGGFQNIGFIEDGDYWSYTPVNLSNIDSIRFRAASPGGGRIEVRTGSASGTLLATATVGSTGAWQTYADFTVAIPASTVSGPLFFVVKNPTGGTGTGGILNVNWVDFNGRGMADTAGLSVSPSSLSFGNQNVGTTSNPQNVTISNPGTASVPVPALSVTGQFTQTNNCPTALGAGASCTVQVRFVPTSAGAKSGTLSVAPSNVALSGTGVSSTTNLALGKPVTASSSNGGFPASNVNDDNASSYWESNNNAFPQWIQVDLTAPSSVASVTLKLPPPAAWATRTQTLTVQGSTDGSNWTTLSPSAGRVFDPATGNTVNIAFTAAAVRYVRVTITANTGWPAGQLSELQIFGGAGGGPVFGVSPVSLNFGSVNVGSTSNPQTVVLSNTGTAAGSVSVSAPAQFAQTNSCGSTLAAGASCNISVTFSPTSAGAKSGNLTVNGLTVALSGSGVGGSSNLALGKPVTASHTQNYVPSNTVDADVNSYWESPNNAFPQSITVDLGSLCSLTSLVLRVPPGWGSRNQTLSLSGSTNGSSYTTIVGSASYSFPAGGSVTVNLPANTTARYVRLTFTANTGWPAAQLSDLQIIGTV